MMVAPLLFSRFRVLTTGVQHNDFSVSYRQSMVREHWQRLRDRRLVSGVLLFSAHVGAPGALEKDFVGWGACLGDMEGRHGAASPSLFRRGRGCGKPDRRRR